MHGATIPNVIHTRHVAGDKHPRSHYRCRRYRKPSPRLPGVTRREPDKGRIGVQCRARFQLTEEPDGSLLTIFRGYHNHGCQRDYLRLVKPVHACQWLREEIDRKLHAGVTKSSTIHDEIKRLGKEKQISDGVFRTHEEARAFYMATALTTVQITNRRIQLGLKDPHITDKDDAESVRIRVETLRREQGDASPVMYYKARGQSNSDTSEEEDSDFNQEDFLLVYQSPGMAKMMRDNPVGSCE